MARRALPSRLDPSRGALLLVLALALVSLLSPATGLEARPHEGLLSCEAGSACGDGDDTDDCAGCADCAEEASPAGRRPGSVGCCPSSDRGAPCCPDGCHDCSRPCCAGPQVALAPAPPCSLALDPGVPRAEAPLKGCAAAEPRKIFHPPRA